MIIECNYCSKAVSTPVRDDTEFLGLALCLECLRVLNDIIASLEMRAAKAEDLERQLSQAATKRKVDGLASNLRH